MTILVVTGVSGAGKTTVGRSVAQRLGWPFKEGDELHPAANIAKMSRGEPLTDADRAPWLVCVCAWIDVWRRAGVSGVITCSALKRAYRDQIVDGRPEVRFVFLDADPAVLAERVANRRGHYMPPSLLPSQLADLQPPGADEGVIKVDAGQPVETQVDMIVRTLARSGPDAAAAPPGATP